MADCDAMLASMPGVPLNDFQSFESSCQELTAGAQLMLQPVAVQMFRVLIDTEGAAQSGSMFPGGGAAAGGGGGNGQPLDPLQPLPPVPPPPPPPADASTAGSGDATGVTQYHAECTSVDVASCVPECNAEHHGYELLATIDGTDTKFSCNLAHGLYSWMGAASEGGYLGSDSASFFSAVVSGAAGSYIVTLTADAGIGTDLTIRAGQAVDISGDPGLAVVPCWGGGGFEVQQFGSLSLSNVVFTATDVVFTATNGGLLSLAQVTLQVQVFAAGALGGLAGTDSRLVLQAVTVVCDGRTVGGPLTGTVTVTGRCQGPHCDGSSTARGPYQWTKHRIYYTVTVVEPLDLLYGSIIRIYYTDLVAALQQLCGLYGYSGLCEL